MRNRKVVRGKAAKRQFTKSAMKIHGKNLVKPQRGGYRL